MSRNVGAALLSNITKPPISTMLTPKIRFLYSILSAILALPGRQLSSKRYWGVVKSVDKRIIWR